MTRYILKKDLPTFNKGETFIFDGDLRRESDNMLAYSQSELDEFPNILDVDGDWFEELPEEYKRWRAEDEQEYFFIDGEGFVRGTGECFFSSDDRRYELGNYFKTNEEAGKALDWLKALTILRDDTKGFKPNWGEISQTKYRVAYRHINGQLYVDWSTEIQHGTIYFASREDAEASIKAHKKEWLTFFNCGGGNE